MSKVILEKTLQAAVQCPALLNEISISSCQETHVLSIFQILAAHKIPPPVIYYNLSYSLLGASQKFSIYREILKKVDTSSTSSMIKSLITNYYKYKPSSMPKLHFSIDQQVKLIKSLSILSLEPSYSSTANNLLFYFSDLIIRSPNFVTPNQSIEILNSIMQLKTTDQSLYCLTNMCKVNLINNITSVSEDLGFYKEVDLGPHTERDFLYSLIIAKNLSNTKNNLK
ncbi:unnamed protein product [Blepharisma stoltei]|uniref:Uncharacterized protein n=1 Tax=Blepharisma stoltei TaxID=1481888 RepID=A0AAU9JXL9_9CILI|nr:unnamed protein product [Blepharisma stoltei]